MFMIHFSFPSIDYLVGPYIFILSASFLIALLPAVVPFLMCTQIPWICSLGTFVASDTEWSMYHPQPVCTVPLRAGAAVHVLIFLFVLLSSSIETRFLYSISVNRLFFPHGLDL